MTIRFFSWALSMHGSFISFIRWGRKTYVLLGTFSEETFLLGVTVSLANVTNLEAFFSRSPAPGACIRGTCARGACTRHTCSGNTYSEGPYTKNACLRGAATRDTCTRDTCVRSVCIKDICIRGTCISDPCAGGFWVRDTYTCASSACIGASGAGSMGICIGSACVDSVSAVERSGMHLQPFWNLEVGGAGLEIRVGGCF